MVGIVDIILNEDLTSELGLSINQEVTASNGVKYQWKGAAWVVTDNAGKNNIRVGSMANKEMSSGLTNLGRQRNGLQPLAFLGGKPVQPDSTPAVNSRPNIATMDPDELFDENDLSRGERRKLSRTGKIQRNGMTFDRNDIRAMSQRLETIRTRRSERINAERKPTMDDYKKSKRAIGNLGRHGVLGTILSLGTGVGAFSTFRQALIDSNTVTDERIAEINASNKSAEEKAIEVAEALSKFYQAQTAIFIAQLVPTTVALYGAVRNIPRVAGIVIRSIRLAVAAGAQGASIFGGPFVFLGALVGNAALFILTEVGMYFAIRWLMRTDTGQQIMFGFLQSEMLKITSDILGPFATNINAHVENAVAPIMDRIQSGAADALEMGTDIIMSTDLEKEVGRQEADRLRREWDRVNGGNSTIQAPDTSGETFDSPFD